MKTVIYELGQESHVILESESNFNNSIFSEVYIKAESILDDYIRLTTQNNNENQNAKIDTPNNIVAFIGERGSGKTSCMMSMRKKIEKNNDRKKIEENEKAHYKNYNYLLLDLIDPSFFDEKVNILELVLANMFKEYKNSECKADVEKTEIIKCFSKVKNNIDRIVGKDEEGFDELNDLVVKASMVSLKENMRELVQKLLDIRYKIQPKEKKSYLLITIDDLDLNTTHAYTMIEQIRKYLILDNIIIFMAVKLDQLGVIIKSHYTRVFKDISYISDDEISEMADRYLSKLIPLNHRAYLPVLDLVGNDKIKIKNYDKKDIHTDSNDYIKEKVLSLIFKGTRFLFYNTEFNSSPIIPNNLRELLNLIKMLVEMDPIKNKVQNNLVDDNSKRNLNYNKAIFLNYFFQSWAPNNLEDDALNILEKLKVNNNVAHINKYVVLSLKKKYDIYLKELSKELGYILNENCVDYNISLGDVMLLIKTLNNRVANPKDSLFFFAIKSYYSILLYKYYDEITEDKEPEEPSLNRLYKREALHHIDSYHKLVGGSYINSIGNPGLPDRVNQTSRSCFTINGKLFRELLNNILYFKGRPEMTFEHNSITYRVSMRSAIVLTEFITLCIDTFHDRNAENYRLKPDVYYDINFSERQENIRFNLTSFFYNIIDYKKTIDRFGIDGLSDYIMENEDSIYQHIWEDVFIPRYGLKDIQSEKEREKKWKSWTCLRNIEILDDILENIVDGIPRLNKTEIDLYGDFFINIGTKNNNFLSSSIAKRDRKRDYYIYTYDVDDQHHYQISFGYATVIGEKLKEILKNEPFPLLDGEIGINILFNNILIPEDKKDKKKASNEELQIKRLKEAKINKTETIRRLIDEQYPNRFKKDELLDNYPDGERMTKKEAEEIINKIFRVDG